MVELDSEFDMPDQWMIDEVGKILINEMKYDHVELRVIMDDSGFIYLLKNYPLQVHHENPKQWAEYIHNKTKEDKQL